MDAVAVNNDTDIQTILHPTINAFLPLLEKHRNEIRSIEYNTFKYGSTDRHQLDVYYPPAGSILNKRVPILFFVYGGGFVAGERSFSPPMDLGYGNVAAYFAKRGLVTIIPDYRLVPHTKFPGPAEDVRDAIGWVVHNIDEVMRGHDLQADTKSMFVTGHSAGSCHIMTMLLVPGLLPQDLRARIRGIIPKGGAFKFQHDNPHHYPATLAKYYGNAQDIFDKMPVTLLRRAPGEVMEEFPDYLIMVSEREGVALREGLDEILAVLNHRLNRDEKISVMKGHNHISPHWALWTGEGEEWAEEVEQWVKARFYSL
ncbi:hypothetical protein A0H81_06915 [Grifola frondosa]|uniref:BD-FAE-like domain-containing protein n=1 Tax=Grifola frondosa TaxID=5627 RepID=A0A1C7M8B1_GRIFR|nr:hypothetical protein A0H81_06915 [Grifola frondosa]